eukprot:CAMPEP_0118637762 /NCGR_PEP_ID=MMETSP0785-20121206/3323_1 /TAXON_ID=91992 /ORGANISM="Bolidomonas pacifica, Strain CCMP 1866" /LENGTH=294 /DNA_ID=CAMNT_0006528965 /DNA_START=135 /DNA_END=1016 /DNA_ORIENTATION=-
MNEPTRPGARLTPMFIRPSPAPRTQRSTRRNNQLGDAESLEQDIELYLQQLSYIHSQEAATMRTQRRHKLLALLCFLFFIVLRLWVMAIYEQDVALMIFCSLCTLATFHMWRRGAREIDAPQDVQIAATLRDIVTAMDLEAGSGRVGEQANNGVGGPSKSRWQRFAWGEQMTTGSDADASEVDKVDEGDKDDQNYKDDKDSVEAQQVEEGNVTAAVHQTAISESADTCSICLCEYEGSCKVVRLPCGHMFHDACLDQWVQNHFRCPLCNEDLRSEDEVRISQHRNESGLIRVEE